jgi:hypothetical protein
VSTVYRRIVFVGLGGSGGKTLRFLKRDINRWFDEIGWTKGMPKGWQFLQIDTPTIQDGVIPTAPMLPDSEYLGLVGPGTTFEDIDRALLNRKENHPEFASWRVNPNALGVPVHTGAGQFRAVGRTVAVGYLANIRTKLSQTFNLLNQPDAQSSLSELFQFAQKKQPTANTAGPIVIVVSSLAGGTGAGLINDVCDILREMDPVNGDASFGLLYTPEVFESVVPSGGGIQPNSLAAISEVMNGYWWNGDAGIGIDRIPMKNSAPMSAAGAVSPIKRTGPAFPFLIGARNSSGVSYTNADQLFEVVGAALTSWATDVNVQTELLGFTFANWAERAGHARVNTHNVIVNQGDTNNNEPGMNPFSALGFARISVGNRYFGAYSAERIARDAIEFVRDNYKSGDVAISLKQGQPNITPPELIERQSEMQFTAFLNRCLLNEKGPSSNQVQDALKPIPSDWEAIFFESVSLASSFVTMTGNHSAKEWMEEIKPAIENAAAHFDTRCQPIIDQNILKWIEAQPKVITNSVSEAIGEYGLHITEALVRRLIQEIKHPSEGIISDLRDEISQYTTWINPKSWSDKAEGAFSAPTRKVPRGDVVDLAIAEGLTDAICSTWIRVKNSSIELLTAFVDGFLEPLRVKLSNAIYEIENNSGDSADWPNWPTDGAAGNLSPNSTPPQSEYTVIQKTEFAGLFDELLAKVVGGPNVMRATHRQSVRTDVVIANFIKSAIEENPVLESSDGRLRMMNITSEWWPGMSAVPSSHIGPKTATFDLNLKAEQLLERSRRWLQRSGNAFKTVLEDGLKSFTQPDDEARALGLESVYAARQVAFMSAFESAINASKPLINLDDQLMAVLLGANHPKLALEMSTLPFGADHPLETAVKNRLQVELDRMPVKKNAESYLEDNSSIKHVDIITSLYGAYPILVIQSILQPIAEAWSAAKTSTVAKGEFWNKRRARGIQEFIPAPQEHIRCMVRGWFLGSLFGLVDKRDDNWLVASRFARQPLAPQVLPGILLTDSSEYGDNIARMLEALGLAYVEVGIRNNLEPLGGYVNLLDLGRSGDGEGAGVNSYRVAADYAEHWIKQGTLPSSVGASKRVLTPITRIKITGVAEGASADDRRDAVVRELQTIKDKYAKRYREYLEELDESVNVLSSPPLWISMSGMINSSLDQIINSINGIEINGHSNAVKAVTNDGDMHL